MKISYGQNFLEFYVVTQYLDGAVDALHHRGADVGISVAESPRTELLLFFVDRLAHEHVREAFAVDEFDEVERLALRRQRVPERPAAFLLLLEHLQYEPVEECRVDLALLLIHRFTHTPHFLELYNTGNVTAWAP